MMSDAIDETLDKDEAEEETEELTNQVLDEIGVDIASQVCFSLFLSYILATNCTERNENRRKFLDSDTHFLWVTVIFSSKRAYRIKESWK